MSNLETLKQELKNQKSAIETKGGTVFVANTNPSPSEITAGIKSIEMPNLEIATATANDVRYGKTFFAGDLFMKTGTLSVADDIAFAHTFSYGAEKTTVTRASFAFPDTCTFIKKYMFYECPNPLLLTLSSNTTTIMDYAFQKAKDIQFTNINDLPKLEAINQYAFANTSFLIDFANMWPSLKITQPYCFYNGVGPETTDINLPALTKLADFCFYISGNISINSINLSQIQTSEIASYAFRGISCQEKLTFPSVVKKIYSHAFSGASYPDIIIPTNITYIDSYAFGASSADPASIFQTKSFTFESEIPPYCGVAIISSNHINNGCKIYVPDVSVETYKAHSSLTRYADVILPISEKP